MALPGLPGLYLLHLQTSLAEVLLGVLRSVSFSQRFPELPRPPSCPLGHNLPGCPSSLLIEMPQPAWFGDIRLVLASNLHLGSQELPFSGLGPSSQSARSGQQCNSSFSQQPSPLFHPHVRSRGLRSVSAPKHSNSDTCWYEAVGPLALPPLGTGLQPCHHPQPCYFSASLSLSCLLCQMHEF